MTDPTDRAKALAEKELPCWDDDICDEEREYEGEDKHTCSCPAHFRPAVARVIQGVLDEIEQWKLVVACIEGPKCGNCRGCIVEQRNALRAENAKLRGRVEKLERVRAAAAARNAYRTCLCEPSSGCLAAHLDSALAATEEESAA